MPYYDLPAQPMMTSAELEDILKAFGAVANINRRIHSGADRFIVWLPPNAPAPWPANASLGTPAACRTHMTSVGGY